MSVDDVLSGRRNWWIEMGHALDLLRAMPSKSVHMVVTSPPFWSLRSYPTATWVGGDETCDHEPRRFDGPKQTQGAQNGHAAVADRLDRNRCRCGAERVESTVWGGVDGCDHLWGDEGAAFKPGHVAQTKWQGVTAVADGQRAPTGAFCQRCPAWRGQLGLEPDVFMYIAHLVTILEEVRRVLRDDGTCWLNIADSYAGSWGAQSRVNGSDNGSTLTGGSMLHARQIAEHPQMTRTGSKTRTPGLKPKDLCLIPQRLAIALQDAGWWVRSDIIWAKKAPMPESCEDRPTSSTEHILLLSRSERYFYDHYGFREAAVSDHPSGNGYVRTERLSFQDENGVRGSHEPWTGAATRNARNFWLLGPSPNKLTHFASFPPEVPRRCIALGTSEHGVCPSCGKPYKRMLAKGTVSFESGSGRAGNPPNGKYADAEQSLSGSYDIRMGPVTDRATIGWEQGCRCAPSDPVGAIVLDPFAGSGTTIVQARRMGRRTIGLELASSYVEMSRRRVWGDAPLFNSPMLAEVPR